MRNVCGKLLKHDNLSNAVLKFLYQMLLLCLDILSHPHSQHRLGFCGVWQGIIQNVHDLNILLCSDIVILVLLVTCLFSQ